MLISHDQAFARKRMANTTGQSVWLHCQQVDGVEVLAEHLTEVEAKLAYMPMVVLEVTRGGLCCIRPGGSSPSSQTGSGPRSYACSASAAGLVNPAAGASWGVAGPCSQRSHRSAAWPPA